MSSSATAVYYPIDILSRNHQILQESRAGECLVLKHNVRIVGNLTLTNGGYRVRETKHSSIFYPRYTQYLAKAAFSTFLLKKEVVLCENVKISMWRWFLRPSVQQRSMKALEGVFKVLVGAFSVINVSMSKLKRRFPCSKESKPAGVASCSRF